MRFHYVRLKIVLYSIFKFNFTPLTPDLHRRTEHITAKLSRILNTNEITTLALLLFDSTGATKEQRHRITQVFTNYIIMTNRFP